MSADQKDQTSSENVDDEQQAEQQTSSDTPELSEEGKEEVRRMQEAYDDDRPTAVLPGTDGTITGVAINEWLDDEGNPKFGDPDEHPFAEDGGEGDQKDESEGDDQRESSAEESKDTADQD
jgi:hypothetical protein